MNGLPYMWQYLAQATGIKVDHFIAPWRAWGGGQVHPVYPLMPWELRDLPNRGNVSFLPSRGQSTGYLCNFSLNSLMPLIRDGVKKLKWASGLLYARTLIGPLHVLDNCIFIKTQWGKVIIISILQLRKWVLPEITKLECDRIRIAPNCLWPSKSSGVITVSFLLEIVITEQAKEHVPEVSFFL